MYNSRKKPMEEVVTELTPVWMCSNDDCNGWMRDNFTFFESPTCPHCKSEMIKGDKLLGVVENNSPVTSKKI